MITKELAKKLLPLVNDFEGYSELQAFVDYRIEILRLQLETATDPNYIYRVQGAISELKLFKRLRDDVIALKDQ